MIELKGLCKSFEEKEVLKDINATFENGKTNLIIGQSGSGKTVLMKCIVGLLTPDKGELLYDHRNFLAMGKKEKKALRREMGMIFPKCRAVRFHDGTGQCDVSTEHVQQRYPARSDSSCHVLLGACKPD